MTLQHSFRQSILAAIKQKYDDYNGERRHRLSKKRIIEIAIALSQECLSDVDSLDVWIRQREGLKAKISWVLGIPQQIDRGPLDAEIKGHIRRPNFVIEKVVFQSLPGLYVTGNLYLSKKDSRPSPCIIYLNGHYPSLNGAKTGYQDRYNWYPQNGFACLVIDPLQFGEIPGIHHGTSRLNYWHWLSLGYTPAGVEVWNAMRAVDWLSSREDVDASRIGVTGISGGGVMSQFVAALDDRIACAAPSCSTYSIGSQARMNLVKENCDCTFFPNVFGLDFPHILALIAPRPLIILGGRKDPVFPPTGFREAYEKVRRIYGLYHGEELAAGRIRLVESQSGHADPPAFLQACRAWMMKWLCPDSGIDPDALKKGNNATEGPETIACLDEMPTDAINAHVHDRWIKPIQLRLPKDTTAWHQRTEKLAGVLKDEIFSWFPKGDLPYHTRRLKNSGEFLQDYGEFGEYEFQTEPSVPVRAYTFRPKHGDSVKSLLVWVKMAADHVSFPDFDEFFPLLRTTAILALTPRFADRITSASEFAQLERTAALTGRTLMALRVWDVIRAISWAQAELAIHSDTVEIYGRGEAGLIGFYAGFLDRRVDHVIVRNPPASHMVGPALLTILRHTDIPEIAAGVLPRHLTFVGMLDSGFYFTRRVAELCGMEASLATASCVSEAVMAFRACRENEQPASNRKAC